MSETQDEMRYSLAADLANNPDWLPTALSAIAEGMQTAIRREQERAALKDQATLAAFALKAGGKMAPELRETLVARIVAAIHPANQCGYERGMIDAYLADREREI